MSAVELLPCPFCGGEPTFIKIGNVHTKMAVTVRCPKCRVERTDATPKAFNNSDHGWLLATAGKNWNKRPAIAPPVAAGSVEMSIKDKIRCGPYPEDFGVPTGYSKEAQLYADWFSASNIERAEKAEARVKELEAGRQSMQAEGKHPAPCARDCEANAFQIEVRRLQAVELNMHRKLAAEKLRADQGWARYEAANRAKNDLERERGHKQSIIDRLMLEYCPDEMTAEQVTEWASHQKRAE